MRRTLVCLMLLALAGMAYAAPEEAGPTAAGRAVLDVNRVQSVLPAKLDLTRIGEEDAMRDRLGLPPRFAVPEKVSITPANQGTWEELGDGRMLWRLRIIGSEGTTSINLGFTRFKLTRNARLLLYSTDGTRISRAFTAADNEPHGQLWTPVVLTDDLIVELTVPKREARRVELELGSINQGYRGFGTQAALDYEKSGSCNLDVECLDAGDTWRQEMRAVGVISTGGSTFCTGSLVNNTAGDRKMYLHDRQPLQHHLGERRLAGGLLELSELLLPRARQRRQRPGGRRPARLSSTPARSSAPPTPPPTSPWWSSTIRRSRATTITGRAGTARPAATPAPPGSPCASIHHPSTDEKRITYVTTDMVSTSYSGTTSPGDGTHLWAKWATDPPGPFTVPGVTEPGSSGSPLYNSAGRFVGQLHGGPSSCGATGNNLSDYYGRFSVSWTGGGTNSTRLSNWLDAGNTGATTTNGIDNGGGCTPPAAPTGVTASASSQTQNNVSWSAVSGATSYTILRSTTSGGPYSSVGTSATTSFANTGLSCNTTYYYVVTASNGSCSSGNSAQAQATTQACTGNVLQNGVPVTGISGATGNQQFWTLSVPAGATNLQFQISGGTGDADMYVRFGSAPTTATYDCRPYLGGNSETCTFPAPAAGTWHVMLNGYSAYSGVTLTGSYSTGSTCTNTAEVEPNNSRTAPQALSGTCNQISGTFLNDTSTGQEDFFSLSLPAGRTVTALLNGLSVDYDLYIYNSTTGSAVASSTAGGTTADQATWTNTGASAVTVYVRVYPLLVHPDDLSIASQLLS